MNPSDVTPHAIVEIDGRRWDSWQHKKLFERVSIDLATNEASEGVWQIFDPEFLLLDEYTGDDGVPMAVMRFFLGFGHDLGDAPLFKGLLARVERGDSQTGFRAYDMGFKMRLVKKSEHHRKMTDVQLIEKLAKRNGLGFVGPTAEELKDAPKAPKHDATMQTQQTDWEHAMECAERSGLVLFVRQDTLFAKPPGKVKKNADLTLTRGAHFEMLHPLDLVFKTPENVGGRPQQVKVHGRGRGGKRLTATAEGGTRGRKELSVKTDIVTHVEAVAKHRAYAERELQREHAFTAAIRTIAPLPGKGRDVRDTIALAKIGKLFNGKIRRRQSRA
jgi:hypothetical protein